jgi:hypothetical protein
MRRWMGRLVRLAWLVVLAGLAAAIARWWAMRSVPQPSTAPQWPPFDQPSRAQRTGVARMPAHPLSGDTGHPRWVLPVEGDCPIDHPVKANDNSGIFHVPDGRFYARTKAERCYVDAESAVADGYRAAKA